MLSVLLAIFFNFCEFYFYPLFFKSYLWVHRGSGISVGSTAGHLFKPSSCHFVSLANTPNSWAEEFHRYITCDICGLVFDRLFRLGFLQALRFPLTAIRQTIKGLWHWVQQESSMKHLIVCHWIKLICTQLLAGEFWGRFPDEASEGWGVQCTTTQTLQTQRSQRLHCGQRGRIHAETGETQIVKGLSALSRLLSCLLGKQDILIAMATSFFLTSLLSKLVICLPLCSNDHDSSK